MGIREGFVIVLINSAIVLAQIKFEDHFAHCQRSDPRFDNCLKEALNSVRPYFKTGLPQYGVKPFDPFHADEVMQEREGSSYRYRLMLRNVTEAGWTSSQITRLRTELDKNMMLQFTHFFPDKRLSGDFEFDGSLFGMSMRTQGTWNLALFDYTQTMTITRNPRMNPYGEMTYDTPIKVDVNVQSCRHMEIHVSNLLGGRPLMENIADRVINAAWPPGFILLRPVIGDLVSTAFTKIFDEDFRNFPFERIIH